jgi:beta-lactamase class A
MLRAFAWLAALALTTPSPLPATAQQAPAAPVASEALKARIAELPALLRGEGDYDAFFAPAFRAAIPKAQFEQISQQFLSTYGPVVAVTAVTPLSADAAEVMVQYRDGTAAMRIAVDPAAPHQVVGLRVTGFTGNETSTASVVQALAGLHGTTGFALARLGDGAPQLIEKRNADRPFAIGSAFKLVILAELVRATNAGERKWTDIVTLDGKTELPGGAYTLSPAGTQVTLRDLAAKMISVSDNSATDILLRTLGRARVEAMLPVVGIADPAGMRPMLSTLDMFKLKGIRDGELARQWLAVDEAGRRAMVEGALSREPALAISQNLFKDGKPVLIERIEWFASPADLVRVMDWLRRNTAAGPGAEARAILAINPGVTAATAARWQYVGYKGGSEPGVLSMTLLLQARDGSWYVLSGSWNDPQAALEETRFIGLIGTAAELAAPAKP